MPKQSSDKQQSIYPEATRGPLGLPNADYLKRSKPVGKSRNIHLWLWIVIAIMIFFTTLWLLGGNQIVNY